MMRLIAAALLASMIPGVALAQEAPAGPDVSQDTAWHNRQMLALAKLKDADGWRPLTGNVRWRRTAGNGSGQHPSVADIITINYAGSFIDGTVFDSSYERGQPATFPLGALIQGWQIAIPKAGVGDTIEIAIPADLAYGTTGKGPIPGDATLFFKVELLAIVPQER